MVYRLACENDVENLAECFWNHVNEDESLNPADKDAYIHDCSEHIKNRLGIDLYCWVADVSGRIVSHIFIIITYKVPKPGKVNPKWGRLSTVRTIPDYRNQGVGSALMEKVKDWSREQQLEELVVWPSEQSVSFYECAGFKSENDVMEILFE